MFALDEERAAALYGPDWVPAAAFYRAHAMDVHDDPDFVLRHLDHPAIDQKIDREFATTVRGQARMVEALAYGDAGFLLTTPGPSLSGVLVDVLGDPDQQELFRSFIRRLRCRTFFAVTEPRRGSDAGNLESRYVDGVLTGQKILFGNGAVAPVGTVLARTGSGPLDTVALLLTPELVGSAAVSRQTLDMFAMRGAQLSALVLNGVPVPESLVLGRHLRPTERGLMGMMKTFHRYRPSVAAMALGHAQAIVDYTRAHFGNRPELADLLAGFDHLLAQARALNLAAAGEVDVDPLRGAMVSLSKQRSTAAAERVATVLQHRLPVTGLLEHPWLVKSLADVAAFEFMEGTTPIHLGNVRNGFLRGELGL
jgi:alkylation response protein AidB-like acyl-CoA dehydrogenase